MKKIILLLFPVFLVFSCSGPEQDSSAADSFPLKTYVMEGDPAFSYEITDTMNGDGWTAYQVRMVSGTWLTEQEVVPVRWWHWLTIIVPDELMETESMMFIGGGSVHDTIPPPADQWFAAQAVATGSVISHLSNIPFQPLNYQGDAKDDRYEDDLIAYGWRQYLESGASEDKLEWLARFPMTRAVVRAMDAVQEISRSFTTPVEQFFVTGASKRGWNTWTTAAVDDRVIGMAPMVIDLLNIVPSFHHHWRCYGEWSPAVDNYVEEGIMDWIETDEFATLLETVGPYSFVNTLTLPKLLINATCDEFFVTDSWKFYWDDLKGESYLQYVPNVGHGLYGSYAFPNLFSFYYSVITEKEIPDFDWNIQGNTIQVQVDPNASYTVSKWEAVNPTARDFRIYVNGEAWIQQKLETSEDGTYQVTIKEPEEGYKAALLEVVIDPGSPFPLAFTTGTLVTPDSYPFEPFSPEKNR